MWVIILILFTGGFAGFIFKKLKRFNNAAEKITNLLIYVLLFFMGLSVGVNPGIMENLDKLGLNAFFIAVFTITGSIFIASVSEKLFMNRSGKKSITHKE